MMDDNSFTGMETKFEPGESHIVDEITSRYQEKERANTSLLRYLNEQQAEVRMLEELRKSLDEREHRLCHRDEAPAGALLLLRLSRLYQRHDELNATSCGDSVLVARIRSREARHGTRGGHPLRRCGPRRVPPRSEHMPRP